LKNFNKVIDYVNPYVFTVGKLLGSLGTAYSVFTNLNKLDDPNATQKNKANQNSYSRSYWFYTKSCHSPVANAAIDTASYLTDLQEGKRDAPPKPADINSRTNPIGDGVNKIINSTPV
jgi:hypothetical protein